MPSPTTTGGGLMGYPSTVDPGQVQPAYLYEPDIADAASAAQSANSTYIHAVTLYANVTLTGFRVDFGAGGNGNYDVGIYDNTATGNLLAHIGSGATATGVKSPTLTNAINLSPGVYWLAFWIDNATDTVLRSGVITNMGAAKSGTNSGGLPSTYAGITSLVNANRRISIIGLLSGGWS